jgi:hypothetical protein
LIIGRKAKISEKPINEINIAAEEVIIEAASIATPTTCAPVDMAEANSLKVSIS